MNKEKKGNNLTDGKFPPFLLKNLLLWRGAENASVLNGPGIGEDAALIRWPEGAFLVASSDPIVGAKKGAGHLLVAVNANDIACKGGDPQYLLVTLIVPYKQGHETASVLMKEIDESCKKIGVSIVGGHTEMTSRYDYPVIVGTMFGPTRYCYDTNKINVHDRVLMTKHAGLEGMSILADDRPDLLSCLTEQEQQEVREWKYSLSVIPEASLLRDLALYMHDPTEGGLWGGIDELKHVCGRAIHVDRKKVYFSEMTRKASQELNFDPCRLISSGVLLAVLPKEHVQEALKRLEDAQIPAAVIGEIGEKIKDNYVERDRDPDEDMGSAEDMASGEELWRLLDLP